MEPAFLCSSLNNTLHPPPPPPRAPSGQLKLELPGFPARLCGRCGISPGRSWLPLFCLSNPLHPPTPVAQESPICMFLELGGGRFAFTLVELRPPG